MRLFLKEILSNPVRYNGSQVSFTPIGQNRGIIQLDESRDAVLIAELDRLADSRTMGVIRTTAEESEELKKKSKLIPLRKHSIGGGVRAFDREPQPLGKAVPSLVAPPVEDEPAPATPAPASSQFKPKTGNLATFDAVTRL